MHIASARLAVAVVGVITLGMGASPAYSASESDEAQALARVTDPAHLVNDPRTDDALDDNAQNSPSLAANGSTVVAAYSDGHRGGPLFHTDRFVGYSVSTDSGETWRDRGRVEHDEWQAVNQVTVAADPGRNRSYLATVMRTTDTEHTETFVFPIDAAGALGSPVALTSLGGSDPWIATDTFPGPQLGTVYVATSAMELVQSTDGGATWSPPTEIPVTPEDGFYRPRIAVTPDHCVHVVYWRRPAGEFKPVIKSQASCDGGASFAPEVVVAPLLERNIAGPDGELFINGRFATNSLPQVAVNPVTGALHVVYNDVVTRFGDADVYLTSSTDGGSTWSPAARVNTDQGDHDQFSPAVAVSADGTRLMTSYYDRRSDPINLDMQRWARIGSIDVDNGTVRLANEFRLGPSFPPVKDTVNEEDFFFSDGEALIAAGESFITAWTDNRDGDRVSLFQSDVRAAVAPTGAVTDVSVTVTAPDDVVALGDTYSYTASVRNDSDQPADNVAVRTLLPLASTYVSATVSGPGSCIRLGHDVTCDADTLDPGESVDVTFTADALKSGPLQRKVVLTTSSLDRRYRNNSAAANGQVATAAESTELFSSGDISAPIDSPGRAVVPLDIDADGIALDVEVRVRLESRKNIELLSMALVSPAGVRVPLTLNDGFLGRDFGTGANSCAGTPAVFDDAATTSVVDGEGPYVRRPSYNPHGTLADTLGGSFDGTWKLVIDQEDDTTDGTVGCVELRVRHTD